MNLTQMRKAAPDSIIHRVLECPSTAHVRANHSDCIQQLQNANPILSTFPSPLLGPHFDFNIWYLDNRPLPQLNDEVLQQIQHDHQVGKCLTFFVDGSCLRPTSPLHRRAAFALVYHAEVDNNYSNSPLNKPTPRTVFRTFSKYLQ